MGIISNKCCRYNTNEEALRNLEGKDEKNKLSKILLIKSDWKA
jgi:hypothetical protein